MISSGPFLLATRQGSSLFEKETHTYVYSIAKPKAREKGKKNKEIKKGKKNKTIKCLCGDSERVLLKVFVQIDLGKIDTVKNHIH